MKKKVLSVILTVCMLVTILPLCISAGGSLSAPDGLFWDTSSYPGEIRATWNQIDDTYGNVFYDVFLYLNGEQVDINNLNYCYENSTIYVDMAKFISFYGSGDYTFLVFATQGDLQSDDAVSPVFSYERASNVITSVELDIDNPIANETFASTPESPSDEYSITEFSWYNTGYDRFRYGFNTAYTTYIVFTANEGYRFDEETDLSINGNDVEIISINDFSAVIEYTFPKTGLNPEEIIIVNGENLAVGDHVVTCGEGSAQYNPDTDLLILDNATITNFGDNTIHAGIYSNRDIEILLVNTNSITNDINGGYGIRMVDNTSLRFELDGSLEISADTGINVQYADFTMTDGTIEVTATGQTDTAIECSGDMYLNGGSLTAIGYRGIDNAKGNMSVSSGASLTATANFNDDDDFVYGISCHSFGLFGGDVITDSVFAYYMIDNSCNITIDSGTLNVLGPEEGETEFNGLDTCVFSMTGGTVTCDAPSVFDHTEIYGGEFATNGLSSYNSFLMNDGVFTSNSDHEGIYLECDAVINGGTLNISGKSIGMYLFSGDLTINDGQVNITSTDSISYYNGDAIMGGVALMIEYTSFDSQTNEWVYTPGNAIIRGGDVKLSGDMAFWGIMVTNEYENPVIKTSSDREFLNLIPWDYTTSLSRTDIKGITIGDNICPFVDISGKWFERAARTMYDLGMMSGTTATTFGGDNSMTRAMFVTTLAKYCEVNKDEYSQSSFDDVPLGQWYTPYVEWAYRSGITGGIGNNCFGPNNTITREQMATFMYVFTDFLGYETTGAASLDAYTDASQISGWAYEKVQWAVANELISGTSDTTISPKNFALRSHVAQILMKYVDLVPSLTPKPIFR